MQQTVGDAQRRLDDLMVARDATATGLWLHGFAASHQLHGAQTGGHLLHASKDFVRLTLRALLAGLLPVVAATVATDAVYLCLDWTPNTNWRWRSSKRATPQAQTSSVRTTSGRPLLKRETNKAVPATLVKKSRTRRSTVQYRTCKMYRPVSTTEKCGPNTGARRQTVHHP